MTDLLSLLFSIVIFPIIDFHSIIWATTWLNQQNECAPSEDSDQPGHPPSLIRVFTVCPMGNWGPKDSEDSAQTGRMPRLIWVFIGHTAILLVLSCHGSFVNSEMKQAQCLDNKLVLQHALQYICVIKFLTQNLQAGHDLFFKLNDV